MLFESRLLKDVVLGVKELRDNHVLLNSTVEEEQANEEKGEEEKGEDDRPDEDEGISLEEDEENTKDPIDDVNGTFAVLTEAEKVTVEDSPALLDVLLPSHLHLPGFKEVEALGVALLKLTEGDQHLVSADTTHDILVCCNGLRDHDKTLKKFVKKYESTGGYSLFGRCLGPDSAENSSAQKTKFAKRYAPACQITEDSRLLYLIIQMLKNRPATSVHSSPTKQVTLIKSQYKRIVDRVKDDPILSGLNMPLPNINSKSISNFLIKQEKKINYRTTTVPKSKAHKTVLSDEPMPEASRLPPTLSAQHPEIQYPVLPHVTGRRQAEKRRIDFDSEAESTVVIEKVPAFPTQILQPRQCTSTDKAPFLLVTPSQPQGISVSFNQQSNQMVFIPPPKPMAATKCIPSKKGKPCAACHVPQCGGLRKRFTPSKDQLIDSKKKIFTYCPTTRKSTTAGFEDVYDDYEHFKRAVLEHLTSIRKGKK